CRAAWGQGFATEAGRRALAIGFGEYGLAEIVSFTATGNAASQAVMRRLSMRRDDADDFDHPAIAAGHPLRRHVLYRLGRSDWESAGSEKAGSPWMGSSEKGNHDRG
ncbi:MAG: GNAT family N-acetyltransferase, partial [Actinobacteria bacterium]|nr:GNAT family N-acetyltransferase [Actinomycetota bacterium]